MNKIRRKAIAAIVEKMEALEGELQALQEEEQGYFEAMPEGLQGSERGMNSEVDLQLFEDASDALTSALDALRDIAGND